MLGPLLLSLMIRMLAGQEPADASAATVVRVGVRPYQGTSRCFLDRVMAGPDGEVVAWYNDGREILGPRSLLPPTNLVVGRMSDSGRANRLYSYVGNGLRLFPIRWAGQGGRLFVRVRERNQRLIAVDADGGPAADVGALDPAWSLVNVNATAHGGVAMLGDPAVLGRIRRVDGETLVFGNATLGAGVELVAARRADLELVRVGPSSLTPLGVNAVFTRLVTAFPDDRDFAGGISYLGATARADRHFVPYQLPVVDLATGQVAGRFGATEIALRRPRGLAAGLVRFSDLRQRSGALILDASLSGDVLLVLTLSGRADRTIYRIGPHGVSVNPLCTRLPPDIGRQPPPYPLASPDTAFRPLVSVVPIDAAGRPTATPGGPILMLHHLGSAPARTAVIYFHGGPAGTLADTYQGTVVERLLEPGRDIVGVEYAGSLGGGQALARGLAGDGVAAIDQDVDAIMRWIDARGYRRVYVIGTSFGAVPALAAISRHRARLAGAFLVAPALRLLEPGDVAQQGRGILPVNVAAQLVFEHAIFGGPDGRRRFSGALDALTARAPFTPDDHFYFAGNDPLSRPDMLPAGNGASLHLFANEIHATVLASDAVWRDILSRLN